MHCFCCSIYVVVDRFIEKYGTHIVVGLSVGGQDVLLVRQDKSSTMGPSALKQHIEELGDQIFTGSCTFSPVHAKSKEHNKNKVSLFPYCLLACLRILINGHRTCFLIYLKIEFNYRHRKHSICLTRCPSPTTASPPSLQEM